MKLLHKNVTKMNQLHNYSTLKCNPSSTTKQNGQTHNNNSLVTVDEMFEFVGSFGGDGN